MTDATPKNSKALLIVDMQVAMLSRQVRALDAVVERINQVANAIRSTGGLIVFIQHEGPPQEEFATGMPGWAILPTLDKQPSDEVVSKLVCDGFCQTRLDDLLSRRGVTDLYICGWATDYCVDTTVRAASSRGFDITIVSDAHTVADREHLDAESIIRHHNVTWAGLDVPGKPIQVTPTAELMDQLQFGGG